MTAKERKTRIPSHDQNAPEYSEGHHHLSEEDFLCGVFSWRPAWLQQFVKPFYFTFVYILFGILQGAMKIGLSGSMTTLERKFGMSGQMISIVMIADNITATVASLVVGYYATKVSRPRILVFGVWLSIMACVFFVLPHFLYSGAGGILSQGVTSSPARGPVGSRNGDAPKGATPKHFTEFCFEEDDAKSTTSPQEIEQDDVLLILPPRWSSGNHSDHKKNMSSVSSGETRQIQRSGAIPVLILLCVGNMLNGVGGISFYIAGTTYTDDNVKKKNSPVYFALILALRMVGPLVGVIVNSYFLSIYEHPLSPPSGISTRDPRWVGAWWIPFVIWGGTMAVVSVPMILFPRHIRREAAEIRKRKHQADASSLSSKAAAMASTEHAVTTSLCEKLKRDFQDSYLAVKRLSKNRVFMWQIIGYIFIVNGFGGCIMNLPKYIEMQYRVSPSKASFLTGSTNVVAMIAAILIGGFAMRVIKPSAQAVCWFTVFANFLYMVVLAIGIFLPCDDWRLSGTQTNDNGSLSLRSACNARCYCANQFQPFCDSKHGQSYFSPCFAGCYGTNLTDMECSCVDNDTTSDPLWTSVSRFTSGFCPNDCNNLVIFIVILSAAKFVMMLPRVGSMLVALRCVDPSDKALAIGFMSFALNILAAIPYPLIYGAIFDSACELWGERDGGKGNCWYYNNDTLRLRFLGTTLIFFGLGAISLAMRAHYAKVVRNIWHDDDEDNDDAAAATAGIDDVDEATRNHPKRLRFEKCRREHGQASPTQADRHCDELENMLPLRVNLPAESRQTERTTGLP